MKEVHFGRRAAFVLLFLILALALAVAGFGQGQGGTASAITGPTGPVVTIGPAPFLATNMLPADGATGVAVNTKITVKFNRDVLAGSINTGTFYVQKQGSAAYVAATISYNAVSRTATFSPNSELLANTVYHIHLTPEIVDKNAVALANPGTWTFTTDGYPAIVSKTPAADAVNVPLDQSVSITFNKQMDASTFHINSFYLEKVGGSGVDVNFSLSADKQTAILDPTANLEPNTQYRVTLTAAVLSLSHLQAVELPYQWTFTTAAAPTLTHTDPGSGATNVPITQSISATFDTDMDSSTLTTATFYIQKSGETPLPATLSYSAATDTATLDPLADLEAGATYQVTLSTAVKGATGATLTNAPITWSFTTAAAAPTITTKTPASAVTDVPVDQAISVTFDKDMDASTLTTATFYIQKSGGTPLPATVSFAPATRTVTLNPLADLEAGATYQVTLSTAVKGSAGQILAGAPVVWSFSTQAAATSSFSDVTPGVTPYATAIAALAADGIITGFPDGTFRPNELVTRQQFAKMIVLALKLPVTGSEVCPFTDVMAQIGSDPFYPSKYVAVCAAAGITTGKTATTFAPYETITHQQLISMVARAGHLSTPPASYTPPFTQSQFSLVDHFLNAQKAAYVGLLDGLTGIGPTYNFFAGSTRGECAELLYKLMTLVAS